MCVAVPVPVLSADGFTARVLRGGVEAEVSLLLLDEEVRPGDYLILQAGYHAVARLDAAEAEERLRLFEQALAPVIARQEEVAQ
ncbi:MAG TPA: HypC/HybG/HupF family hydrogenase formation chaperone [Hyphomicrobiales bacterium]|nr:HypC/HybG/HupF family hydrogenase formation chaperone [Kaistiaceae bacterium]HQF29835.1 HypC/HybG/HupF family hydrogenase formation chaperone [Hyphomicrobiales bacterium]